MNHLRHESLPFKRSSADTCEIPGALVSFQPEMWFSSVWLRLSDGFIYIYIQYFVKCHIHLSQRGIGPMKNGERVSQCVVKKKLQLTDVECVTTRRSALGHLPNHAHHLAHPSIGMSAAQTVGMGHRVPHWLEIFKLWEANPAQQHENNTVLSLPVTTRVGCTLCTRHMHIIM